MYCKSCGEKLEESAAFCGHCGAQQKPAEAAQPAIAAESRETVRGGAGIVRILEKYGRGVQVAAAGLSFLGVFMPWLVYNDGSADTYYTFAQFRSLMEYIDSQNKFFGMSETVIYPYLQAAFLIGCFVLGLQGLSLVINIVSDKAGARMALAASAAAYVLFIVAFGLQVRDPWGWSLSCTGIPALLFFLIASVELALGMMAIRKK